LSYILDVWKRKNQLKHVTIFLPATPPREPWDEFPDILQPRLKTNWILSLLQPLTQFFEIHNIDYSADINTADQVEAQERSVNFPGQNALRWAAGLEDEWLVEQMLTLPDPGIDEPDIIGNTPLFNAVRFGTPRTMELLIDTGKVDVNRLCWLGVTPLGAAIMDADTEKAALLLNRGNAVPDRFMRDRHPTALWYAASENNREIVDLLLRHQSVDVNVKDGDGQTPLHAAIERHGDSSIDVVRALLKRANLSIKDRHNHTPLSLAQDRGYTRIVEELHKWDVD
jgi:ankyrin repeat protein